MKREVDLRHIEWRVTRAADPTHLVYATLTWSPTDRVNEYPARYTAILAHVWRDGVCSEFPGVTWDVGNPMETVCRTLVSLPKGARRSRATDAEALTRFDAFLARHLADYLERYGLSIDADAPDLCAP